MPHHKTIGKLQIRRTAIGHVDLHFATGDEVHRLIVMRVLNVRCSSLQGHFQHFACIVLQQQLVVISRNFNRINLGHRSFLS